MEVIRMAVTLYIEKRVSRAAAQLAFFLIMSIFPILICLCAMLGNFADMERIMELAEYVVPREAFQVITDYLGYVSLHNNRAMLMAGLILMATTSAKAFRSLYQIMGEILGKERYSGAFSYFISILYSLVFLAAIYFSVIAVVTGNWFLRFIDDNILFISVAKAWAWLRFVLLFLILNVIIYGVYMFTSSKARDMALMPGALAASVALVVTGMVFSWFIDASARYSIVYGSLGSMIIMMLWLYICCNAVISGNVLNLVLYKTGVIRK